MFVFQCICLWCEISMYWLKLYFFFQVSFTATAYQYDKNSVGSVSVLCMRYHSITFVRKGPGLMEENKIFNSPTIKIFGPVKLFPSAIYTQLPAFLEVSEASRESIFWDASQHICRSLFSCWNIIVFRIGGISWCRFPLSGIFTRRTSHIGEYRGCGRAIVRQQLFFWVPFVHLSVCERRLLRKLPFPYHRLKFNDTSKVKFSTSNIRRVTRQFYS